MAQWTLIRDYKSVGESTEGNGPDTNTARDRNQVLRATNEIDYLQFIADLAVFVVFVVIRTNEAAAQILHPDYAGNQRTAQTIRWVRKATDTFARRTNCA